MRSPRTSTVTENNDSTGKLRIPNPGGDIAKRRFHRLIAASLVFLCLLLLVGVIILWILFSTQTKAINQLRTECSNVMLIREQFQTSYENLTTRNKQLQSRYDQLRINFNNLTVKEGQLQISYENLTAEQRRLNISYTNLTDERNELQKERDELNNWLSALGQGWSYFFNSSFYYISVERKSWTESQKDCKARGGDLVIINSEEEKNFIAKSKGNTYVWIGLTDVALERTWKWVDDSALTYKFWGTSGQPGNTAKDCALFMESWLDEYCTSFYRWMCEKRI